MSFAPRSRLVNPRLGTYFGILTSAFVSITLLCLVLEQLGVSDQLLRLMMLAGPLALYAAVGIASMTGEPLDFYASGRRVPAFYSGLILAVTAMGATGLLAATGVFFVSGFDALYLVIGGLAGFVLMALLLAPFLRKFGTFTIPSYLGRRFHSRLLRVAVAAMIAVPIVLVLAAELRLGAFAASELAGLSRPVMIFILAIVTGATLAAGGMRSLSWSNVGQALAAVLALMVPVTIVAVLLTNLPVPQLSHGPILREMARNEPGLAVPDLSAAWFAFDLPGEGLHPIAKRFVDAFGSVAPGAFIAAIVITMTGVAASPWLLPRVAATPGVYEARKALGWATLLFGVIMLTLASIAIFLRHYIFEFVLLPQSGEVAPWIKQLIGLGYADVESASTRFAVANFRFDRDSVLYSLPIAAGLPGLFLYLALAGGVAMALAAASATSCALANIISEDVINGLSWDPPSPGARILTGRICLFVAALAGAMLAVTAPTDPLKLLMWALAITGATLFPALLLSIWWKRMTVFGAAAGTITGFATATLAILAAESGWLELASGIAGIAGLPVSVIATLAVSYLTPPPGKEELELMRDLRVPGGEIIYDRELRTQRLRQRQRN